jgi:hypothetical protein
MKKIICLMILLVFVIGFVWSNPFVGRWKATDPALEEPEIFVFIFDDTGNLSIGNMSTDGEYEELEMTYVVEKDMLPPYWNGKEDSAFRYVQPVRSEVISLYAVPVEWQKKLGEELYDPHWDISTESKYTKKTYLLERRSPENIYNQ